MPFDAAKNMLAERARKGRQTHNGRQAFFKLPAELRNCIYESLLSTDHFILQYRIFRQEKSTFDRFADSRHVWNRNGQWYSQIRVPALLSVCRQMRLEFMPMLFAAATASLNVNVPNIRKTTFGNEQSYVDVFEDSAIRALQRIEIRSDYECSSAQHRPGYAGPRRFTTVDSMKVVIERVAERVDIVSITTAEHEQSRRECCREASRAAVERLVSVIKSLRLHEKNHELCKDDFRKLTHQMEGKTAQKAPVEPKQRGFNWALLRRGRHRSFQEYRGTTNVVEVLDDYRQRKI